MEGGAKVATKLKNLKIRKVDFVDEGANPDANIKMFKRREEAAGMGQEERDSAAVEIQKGDSVSFHEKVLEVNNQKIADEIWDVCCALQASFCSILYDGELDSTQTKEAMAESLEEFYEVVQESVGKWAEGKVMNLVRKQKGEEEEMKIDKSKLTEAERAFLESIEKRCGVEEGREQAKGGAVSANMAGEEAASAANATAAVTKTVVQAASRTEAAEGTGAAEAVETWKDDIYKGLHPAVRAELEELKKFREEAEDRELAGIAKRYALIGKKEEELVPLFKSLKAAGGTAYEDMLAVLDQAVKAVEHSGVFAEIGKSGHGETGGTAWAEAETKAAELMKSRTGLSKVQALEEVFLADPVLAEKCEKEG